MFFFALLKVLYRENCLRAPHGPKHFEIKTSSERHHLKHPFVRITVESDHQRSLQILVSSTWAQDSTQQQVRYLKCYCLIDL